MGVGVGVRSIRAWRRLRRQRRACTAHLSHLKQRQYAHHSCLTSHWTAEAEACVSGADGTNLDHCCRCILRWNPQPRMIRRWDRRARVASTFRAGMRWRRNRRRRKWVAAWCVPLAPTSLARSLQLFVIAAPSPRIPYLSVLLLAPYPCGSYLPNHLSLFLGLFLAMILPRVIRRVSSSCWCGLCGCVGLWLWVCGSVAVGVRSVRAWRRVRRQRRSFIAHLSHLKQRRYAHHSWVTSHSTAEAEACVSGADGTKLDHCRCILRWNPQPRMIRRWDRREGVAITFRAGMRWSRNWRRRKWVTAS